MPFKILLPYVFFNVFFSSPGPDRIAPVLIQNGGENFSKSLSYFKIVISYDIFQNIGNKVTGYTLKT